MSVNKNNPQRLIKRPIQDPVNPQDFNKLNLIYCCEQCIHFSTNTQSCSLDYPVQLYLQKNQLKNYELNGKMTLCRFIEIEG